MRVNSFTVEGYKNLTAPVTFGPLDSLNVLHGPNNAGKTNLLGAMELFFGLLAVGNQVSKDQHVTMDPGEAIPGHSFSEIFTAGSPEMIRWQVELSLPAEELRAANMEPEVQTDPVTISLELEPVGGGAQLRVTQFQLGKIDVAKDSSGPVGFAESLRAFIAGTYFLQTEETTRPFLLLDPFRPDPAGDGAPVRGLMPQQVRDALFDARQSLDRARRARWMLFVQLMQELEPELGPGVFDTAFDRAAGRANLVFDNGITSLSIDRLGAGVQRMAALVASLALARGMLLAFSEPELGLTQSAQQRFGRALGTLLATPGGPSQLFFTTHSPVLGVGETAFALTVQDGAPALEQRSCEGGAGLPPLPGRAPAGKNGSAGPEDLDALIGLVDQLAEMEPEELVTIPAGAPAAATKSPPKPAPAAEAEPAPPPGTPSWKWQPKG